MNRRYARPDLERLFSALRERIPGVALRTTVMVGYPGEGSANSPSCSPSCAHTLREPRRVRVLAAAGTKAATMPGAVAPDEARGATTP